MLAERPDSAGSDLLQDILRREAAAYDDGRVTEARHHSRDFHIAFTELPGNATIARFARELIDRQPPLAAQANGRPSSFSGVIVHTKTLAAPQQGDGRAAEAPIPRCCRPSNANSCAKRSRPDGPGPSPA